MEGKKILIVEDEHRLAEVLRKQLAGSGFYADVAPDGLSGFTLFSGNAYDLIILDILLPHMDGYRLCEEIRKINSRVPIIMLTALGTPEDKLHGFGYGADDYVLKPFDFRELLARIHVFLKRSALQEGGQRKLMIADLEMNMETKSVSRGGRKIELTTKEFALLETFLQNKEKLLTREFLVEKVWGIDFETNTNILDVYINYLRKKIDTGSEKKLIHTKFGFGYYCSEKEL